MKAILPLVLLLAFSSCSQQPCQYADDYIPADLSEAIEYLDCVLDEETKKSLKSPDKERAIARLHFGLGLQLRNQWGLWKENNSLVKYFNSLGITHPDDMSGIILTTYYRRLNNKEIQLEQQVSYYKNYWSNLEKNNEMTPEEQEQIDSIMHKLDLF